MSDTPFAFRQGKPGHDPFYGRGFINAEAAVAD
jgi:hypothetical protein